MLTRPPPPRAWILRRPQNRLLLICTDWCHCGRTTGPLFGVAGFSCLVSRRWRARRARPWPAGERCARHGAVCWSARRWKSHRRSVAAADDPPSVGRSIRVKRAPPASRLSLFSRSIYSSLSSLPLSVSRAVTCPHSVDMSSTRWYVTVTFSTMDKVWRVSLTLLALHKENPDVKVSLKIDVKYLLYYYMVSSVSVNRANQTQNCFLKLKLGCWVKIIFMVQLANLQLTTQWYIIMHWKNSHYLCLNFQLLPVAFATSVSDFMAWWLASLCFDCERGYVFDHVCSACVFVCLWTWLLGTLWWIVIILWDGVAIGWTIRHLDLASDLELGFFYRHMLVTWTALYSIDIPQVASPYSVVEVRTLRVLSRYFVKCRDIEDVIVEFLM